MTDRFTVRAVVVILGVVLIAGVVGGMLLAYRHVDLPEPILAIVSAAGGALAALLAKTSVEPPPGP